MKKETNSRTKRVGQDHPEHSALADFFHEELKDIYWAEKHLVKALPKMQKAATSEELSTKIGNHLEETKEHVSRLEQVFELLGHKPQAKKCDGIEGIVKEGDHAVERTEAGTATRDVAIILAAQKAEHYEIGAYGCLAQLAKTLGYDEIKDILGTTLSEEKKADDTLTEVAEKHINYEAAAEMV